MMLSKHVMKLVMACGLVAGMAVDGASAQEGMQKPHVPLSKTIGHPAQAGPIPSLAVINAQGARLEGNQLTLTGVSPSSIVFADRPVRAAGHVPTSEVVTEWSGAGTFAKDPPNATVSVLGTGSGVSDAVVTLRSARLDGNDLVFDVAVLEGNLTGATGPAALFIDRFGWGWRGRGAWYAGAAAGAALGIAAGAAAASPYYYPSYPAYPAYPYPYPYPPRCGHYPNPPCY
jgi:hypothetical protein